MILLLKLDKVSKVYGEGNMEVIVFYLMLFDVKVGEFIGIVGFFGLGKSMLLLIVGVLLLLLKGDIYICE